MLRPSELNGLLKRNKAALQLFDEETTSFYQSRGANLLRVLKNIPHRRRFYVRENFWEAIEKIQTVFPFILSLIL